MNLHHLHYFAAVGKFSSVSKAAREIHVSQPAVSEAVKQLESELGVHLLHRVRQRVYLTEEGAHYLTRVTKVLDELNAANEEMIAIGKNRKTIRLGSPPMIGSYLFPRIFAEFKDHRPDIDLALQEGGSAALVQRLVDETLDLAIVSLPHDYLQAIPGLSFRVMKNTEFLYCTSRNHRLAGRDRIPIEELAAEKLLLNEPGYMQHDLIAHAFSAKNLTPQVMLYTNQLATIVELIQLELGSSFILSDALARVQDVVAMPLEDRIILEMSLVWKTSRTQYRDVKTFIDFVTESSIIQEQLPG